MTHSTTNRRCAAILGITGLLFCAQADILCAQETSSPPPPPKALISPEAPADTDVAPPPDAQPEGAAPHPSETPAPAETPPPEPQMDILTRGPVHEAFAKPYEADPQPNVVVAKKPPEAIEELPPENMPEGENVQWIPGYWDWDDDREDFVWVSGLWRDIPPGQRWVPGYWTEGEGGYQWVSGFWTDADGPNITYLPPPPETLEQGPNVASPGDNYFWIPGCWMYQDLSYRWRPGYWAPCYDDWVWMPDCYHWSPRGYVYTRGYWDYRFPRRGCLFAPVYFPRYPYYGYRYTPGFSIALGHTLIHLFVRPRYSNYYFGDYYGSRYAAWGLRPWHYPFGRRYRYDPLLVFYRSYYRRHGLDFDDRLNRWHRYYDRYPDRRPPSTFARAQLFEREHRGTPHIDNALLARPLREVARGNDGDGRRFRSLSPERRTEVVSISRDFRNLARQRNQFERTPQTPRDGVTVRERGGAPNVGRAPNEGGSRRERRTFTLPNNRTIAREPFSRDRDGSDGPSGRIAEARSLSERSLSSKSRLRVPQRPDTPSGNRRPDFSALRTQPNLDRFRSLQNRDNASGTLRTNPRFGAQSDNTNGRSRSGIERAQPSLSNRSQPSTDRSRSFENLNRSLLTPSRPEFNRSGPQLRSDSSRSLPQLNRSQPQFSRPSSPSTPSAPQYNRSLPQLNRSQPQFSRPSSPSTPSAPQYNRSQPQRSFPSRSFGGSSSSSSGARSFSRPSQPQLRSGGSSSSSRGGFSGSSSRGFSGSSAPRSFSGSSSRGFSGSSSRSFSGGSSRGSSAGRSGGSSRGSSAGRSGGSSRGSSAGRSGGASRGRGGRN